MGKLPILQEGSVVVVPLGHQPTSTLLELMSRSSAVVRQVDGISAQEVLLLATSLKDKSKERRQGEDCLPHWLLHVGVSSKEEQRRTSKIKAS